MPSVSVRELSLNFGDVQVLRNLNLDIEEGEFVTMLGPSGSGKTTCLMMLAGFETPTNGEIYLDGNPISKTGNKNGTKVEPT